MIGKIKMNQPPKMIIVIACALAVVAATRAEKIGPWDMDALNRVPKAEWGATSNGVQQVYFEGEPLSGRTTRVFAYFGKPMNDAVKFPAVLLVHGGGGKAFPDWVRHWTARGYAAIAMDTAGHGPAGRLPDGGPDQNDNIKFRDFTGDDARNMWTYHAVADVLLAHALIASRPDIDAERIAETGISWGGYLSCIIAGLDHRLKASVPVYGCGFLDENSYWLPQQFKPMTPERRARWVENFDPSRYVGRANCPMLFLDGTCDFAYPMDSLQKTYNIVTNAPVALSVEINRKHGHIWNFPEVDAFIDSFVRDGKPLANVGPLKISDGIASCSFSSPVKIAKAELNFTTDTGTWQKRKWNSAPAEIADNSARIKIPEGRPMVCYLRLIDERGCAVTTPHVELP